MPLPTANQPTPPPPSPASAHLWETATFSCEEFAEPLREHERLIVVHAGELYAALRRAFAKSEEEDDPELDDKKESFPVAAYIFLAFASQAFGVITSFDGRVTVEVVDCVDIKGVVPVSARNVRRKLVEPGTPDFSVVVITHEAISLRAIGLEGEDLENPLTPMHLYLREDQDIVVEPLSQVHRRVGRWLVSFTTTPRHVLRIDLIRLSPARTPEERLDHLFTTATARLREQLWTSFLGKSDPRKAWLSGSDADGIEDAVGHVSFLVDEMRVFVANRAFARMLNEKFPRIRLALEEKAPRGWLPVVVRTRNVAGIRWLRVTEGGDGAPDPITEWRKPPPRPVDVGDSSTSTE